MFSLDALFLTRKVDHWLATSRHPALLHVFDRACNLINERTEVLSVVTSEIGPGPFNLVVDKLLWFSDHINLHSPISAAPNELQIGNLVIQVRDASVWDARPDWNKMHTDRSAILRQVKTLHKPTSLVSTLQVSDYLSESIANVNLSAAVLAAKKLAGLGQGLTPSGDDFILGALHAAWIIHPQKAAEDLTREIAATAAPLTTSLSGAWLTAAGDGEAGVLWHAFLDSLVSGEHTSTEESMSKILSMGATSGADTMAGFINTFNCYARLERKHVISKVL